MTLTDTAPDGHPSGARRVRGQLAGWSRHDNRTRDFTTIEGVSAIISKLHVRNRREAARVAHELNLID